MSKFSLFTLIRRLIELTGHQQQAQHTLLDWLRVEDNIEKPSTKLLADSDTSVAEVKRIRGPRASLSRATFSHVISAKALVDAGR